jgi:peptidoglycan/LPS O-acetylase OafA/YrhL
MGSSNQSGSRSPAIDIVKGLAIVSVICLHSLSAGTLHRIGALYLIWQAVPVFIFLMGVNAARSFSRRGRRSLRELYSWDYLASRVDRVFVPFLLAFLATTLVGALTAEHRSAYTLLAELVTGQLPIGGPGNYFITLLFQLTLVFPLIYWGLRRQPLATVTVCLAANATFELLAPHVGFLKSDAYLYEAAMLRYLFLVALGGAVANMSARRLSTAWWMWCGALVSVAFLALAQFDASAIPFGLPGWENSDFVAAFYPATLVLGAMFALPRLASSRLSGAMVELGRASYHIFLFQIVWFGLGVWRMDSLPALIGNLTVTLLAGLVFYRLMARLPLPTAAGLLAKRRGTHIRRNLRLTS